MLQVTEGCGRVLVLAVGVNSEWGKTMAMCQSEPGETPLQQQLEKMAGGIAKLGLGVAAVCFVVLMLRCAWQLDKGVGGGGQAPTHCAVCAYAHMMQQKGIQWQVGRSATRLKHKS